MRIFDDYTAIKWEMANLRLYYVNYVSKEATLEESIVYSSQFKNLMKHLDDHGSVWDFENLKVYNSTNPTEIVDILGSDFDAFVLTEDLDRYLLDRLERMEVNK